MDIERCRTMTESFVQGLRAVCGAILHVLWKIEQSGNTEVIPTDLAAEISG